MLVAPMTVSAVETDDTATYGCVAAHIQAAHGMIHWRYGCD